MGPNLPSFCRPRSILLLARCSKYSMRKYAANRNGSVFNESMSASRKTSSINKSFQGRGSPSKRRDCDARKHKKWYTASSQYTTICRIDK